MLLCKGEPLRVIRSWRERALLGTWQKSAAVTIGFYRIRFSSTVRWVDKVSVYVNMRAEWLVSFWYLFLGTSKVLCGVLFAFGSSLSFVCFVEYFEDSLDRCLRIFGIVLSVHFRGTLDRTLMTVWIEILVLFTLVVLWVWLALEACIVLSRYSTLDSTLNHW